MWSNHLSALHIKRYIHAVLKSYNLDRKNKVHALMGIIVWAIAKDFSLKQIQNTPAETPPSNEDKKLDLSLCLSEYV